MEMLDESLKRNIIVAMDTGSGKTHIAILRIRSYLESGGGKLCWLLVPSVPLGNQQFDVIRSSLPPMNIQFLSGSDNVDKWKTQDIWDRILKLKESASTVVVSTHQILLDALTHGFVGIDSIGLLIFDEAHHCAGNHPANRIMQDFYHPNLHRQVPSVLGLTASPIVKSKPRQLQVIESNLNAISRTPILNREELMEHVHTPLLKKVTHEVSPSINQVVNSKFQDYIESLGLGRKRGGSPGYSSLEEPPAMRLKIAENDYISRTSLSKASEWSAPAFRTLSQAYNSMDIMEDPRVITLLATQPPDLEKIRETIEHKKTRSFHQMHGIVKKAEHIITEYGIWGAEWYVTMIVNRALGSIEDESESSVLAGWDEEEKIYFCNVLRKVTVTTELRDIRWGITDKVARLIALLVAEFNGKSGGNQFSGLVFVEQRVGVSVLAEILREYPDTREIFDVGTLVGTSDNSAKTGRLVYEPTTLQEQKGTIEGFRRKTKNIVISTSVVEEGLDIPACHLVVCFSLPKNVKSFIQRRGRARQEKSTYYLMFEEGSDTREKIAKLEQLEREMIQEYMDETRELEKRLNREEGDPDEDGVICEAENRKFLVKSTNALLTLGSALMHLHHFCNTLPYTEFTDLRPIFKIEAVYPSGGFFDADKVHYRAEVMLPNAVPQDVRRAVSKESWATKGLARRDAAFEAYLALYKLEDPLINDNLLPLVAVSEDTKSMPDTELPPPLDPIRRIIDPWADTNWAEASMIYATPIILSMPSKELVKINIFTTMECPNIETIPIFWTKVEKGEISLGQSYSLSVDQSFVEKAKKRTYDLLYTVHAAKMETNVMEFPYLFSWGDGAPLWGEEDGTNNSAYDAYKNRVPPGDMGIIREAGQEHSRYVFIQWRTDISPLEEMQILEKYKGRPIDPDQPVMEVHRLSHRRDFLHQTLYELNPAPTFLLPQYCTTDKIPWRYSQFALFAPGIIHRIGLTLMASDIQNSLLSSVGFKSVNNVLTALCTSSARELHDYQRLEFLGDSVLKFLVSINLLDEHPSWHEGVLSVKKAKIISNATLAKAAQGKGLTQWIISEEFTGAKWSPRYIHPANEECAKRTPNDSPPSDRTLSRKVLADVVEALIGAAYVEGGYDQALRCIDVFGLDLALNPLQSRASSLFRKAGKAPPVKLTYLKGLQDLLGYQFKHQSLLLEAVTHPSSELPSPSYQRLEFLGDAILDMFVVDELYQSPKNLPPVSMHLYKSSVVNGGLLAFLSMSRSTSEQIPTIEESRGIFNVIDVEQEANIWDYVQLSHPEMIKARKRFFHQYDRSRLQILTILAEGDRYPWAEIALLEADINGKCKLFADMFEAIVGAVFVDSNGDFEVVKALAERFDIFRVLRIFVEDETNVMHPFTRLNEAAARLGKGAVEYECVEEEDGVYVYTTSIRGIKMAVAESMNELHAKVLAAERSLETLERAERCAKEGAQEERLEPEVESPREDVMEIDDEAPIILRTDLFD